MSVFFQIANGSLALGIWQGIYLYEHRLVPHKRDIVITVCGNTSN